VALMPKIAAGPKADYAFIQYCTNDVNSSTPDVPGCLANIKSIVAGVEALGMVPIVCTPPAIGDPNAVPSDPATAIKAQALQAVEQGEQALAKNDPRVILIDNFAQTVTPGDPMGHFLPDYAPVDGIHPSSYGEVQMARAAAAYLQQFTSLPDLLPTSIADDATLDPSAPDIIQNGLMSGTGGTIVPTPDTTITGTVPNGWSIYGFGATSASPLVLAVSGNATHAGVPGYTLDIDVTSAANGTGFQVGTNGAGGSSFGTRIVAGKWYQCGFELRANSAVSHFNVTGQVLLNYPGGQSTSVFMLISGGVTYENGIPLAAGATLQVISQPFYLPAQPSAGAYLYIKGYFSGSGNGSSLSLGRTTCQSVAAPYQ
jgi:hypothetical protein